jgi:PAS domain S-box-containing protein
MDDGVAQLGLDARAVLDAAPDGMVIVADDGRIVAVDSELEHQFGYSADEMIGSTIEMLAPRQPRPPRVPAGWRVRGASTHRRQRIGSLVRAAQVTGGEDPRFCLLHSARWFR